MKIIFNSKKISVIILLCFFSILAFAQKKSVSVPVIVPSAIKDSSAVQDVNGSLPEKVLIRTMTQTCCKYFDFVLVDGRIYSKKAGSNKWELFLKTGLPECTSHKKKEFFETPTAIREISADADALYAFDEQGIMYVCYIAKGIPLSKFRSWLPDKLFKWRRMFGWPTNDYVVQNDLVNKKRGWSMGARRIDVLWHEDVYGNPHHYGTMGIETIYFLTEDGQNIRFTDSGLQADFSRLIKTPHNGAFIAENISASASTLFIIGNQGSLFTRLIDFDTMGCDPMFFQYTYDRLPQKYTGFDYLSNYSPWALPSEEWYEQPKIPLSGKAKLTKMISIEQNGMGNSARELRVAGTNAQGEKGYYHKNIMDSTWQFTKADFNFSSEVFLDSTKNEYGNEDIFAYEGSITKNNEKLNGISCSIKNVALSSDDRGIISVTDGKQTFTCNVFPVEKWTYLQRYNPGRDGTPRYYFITMEFEESSLKNYTGEFKELIEDMFAGKNHELFALSAEASTSYYQIDLTGKDFYTFLDPVAQQNKYSFFMTKDGDTSVQPFIYKSGSAVIQSGLKNPFSEELVLTEKDFYTIEDKIELQTKIEANKAYNLDLQSEMQRYINSEDQAELSRWGYNLADLITKVTFLNKINFPKIKQMTSFGSNLLQTNATLFNDIVSYANWTYPPVQELVLLRIKYYSKLLEELNSVNQTACMDSNFLGSFDEYYRAVGFPNRAEQVTVDKKTGQKIISVLEYIGSSKMYPWFVLQINDGTKVLIQLKNSTDVIISNGVFSKDLLSEKPLRFEASFSMVTIPQGSYNRPPDNDNVMAEISSYKGDVLWDGNNIRILVKNAILTKKEIFCGQAAFTSQVE